MKVTSDSDSSDEDRPMPKKRVKLVAKKAGGPGASGRKRSVAAVASSVPRARPKKRAKSSAKAAYSKKELRTSQQLSLKKFIKTNMIFNKTAKMNKLQRDSFVVNSAGMPIGTKMNAMNRAYKGMGVESQRQIRRHRDGRPSPRSMQQAMLCRWPSIERVSCTQDTSGSQVGTKVERQQQAVEESRWCLFLQGGLPKEVDTRRKN